MLKLNFKYFKILLPAGEYTHPPTTPTPLLPHCQKTTQSVATGNQSSNSKAGNYSISATSLKENLTERVTVKPCMVPLFTCNVPLVE